MKIFPYLVYTLKEYCIITCNFHVMVNELHNLSRGLLITVLNIFVVLHSAVIGDNDHNCR